jgi:hypothetical protein
MHESYLEGECHPNPKVRDLPPAGGPRFRKLAGRAIRLRCPYCGAGGIIHPPFGIETCCPKCGYRFAPEDGYFLGGYALNLVGSEVLGLGVILFFLLRGNYSLYQQEAIAIGAAILLPIIFFPWSRTAWMALDLMVQGDHHLEKERVRSPEP